MRIETIIQRRDPRFISISCEDIAFVVYSEENKQNLPREYLWQIFTNLECEEHLHRVVVLEELEDERLDGLPDVLLAHFRDERLDLRLLRPAAVHLRVGLVVGVVGVDPGELQFTAKLAPGTFSSGSA